MLLLHIRLPVLPVALWLLALHVHPQLRTLRQAKHSSDAGCEGRLQKCDIGLTCSCSYSGYVLGCCAVLSGCHLLLRLLGHRRYCHGLQGDQHTARPCSPANHEH